jgi:hypothetical protein
MMGVQFTANLGQEWMGIRATTQRKDFQVSKRGIPNKQRGLPEKSCEHASQCIYRANKRMCLGYK